MNLQELKEIAYNHPQQIEICWDKIDEDPRYREEFEHVVRNTLDLLPGIETIYSKLIEGESVLFQGESTSLHPAQVEEYKELVEEELFAGYQMLRMWETYQKVQNVINA